MLQKYRNYKCFDPNKTILGSSHRKMNEPVTLSYFMFSKKATKFDKIFTADLTLTKVQILSNFVPSKKTWTLAEWKSEKILHCTVHISTGAEQGDSNWKMGLWQMNFNEAVVDLFSWGNYHRASPCRRKTVT